MTKTHIERDVRMSAIDRTDNKACVACHGSMDSTLSKKCTVHIVRCIAWNSPDHVRRICHKKGVLKNLVTTGQSLPVLINRMRITLCHQPIYLRFIAIFCFLEKWSCRYYIIYLSTIIGNNNPEKIWIYGI